MEKIGLVLSGGGAKGAYQIGAWKALKKTKIKYQIVTGTSVGALNGLMFVQKDYHKAYKIWKNIDYDFIFDDTEKLKIKKQNIYKTYASEIFKHGGMEVKQLEKTVEKAYNEKKFYSSKIDYGMVTFNLSKMKPEFFTKSKLPKDKIKDYVVASASCFPAFKKKNIDGINYIDGGYYDNMPINLCVSMGATRIIAIDVKAIGIKRKLKDKNIKMITISPKNKIIPMLVFDKKQAMRTMKLGYNDTMKVFEKYEGKLYTYKKNQIKKISSKIKLTDTILELITKLKIKKHQQIINELTEISLIDTIEYAGIIFGLEETKIYTIRKFNKNLIKASVNKKFEKIDKIETKIDLKSKKINGNPYFIKYILEAIYNSKIILKDIINYYPREFLVALYLYNII